jgi:putative N6-adenine-specific DNA methylase
MKFELIATAAFGLEAVVRRELEAIGCRVIKTENGRVTFEGSEEAIARANIWLRSSDRVLIKMGEFRALESDDLFMTVKGMPWENLIPPDGKFTVNCSTVKSKLRSEPNNQKTVKKAIVERLSQAYGMTRFPETGASYTVKVSLLKDTALITVDTTGESLHKRGYRTAPVTAPIKETVAAAMVSLILEAGKDAPRPVLRIRHYSDRSRHDGTEHRPRPLETLRVRGLGSHKA